MTALELKRLQVEYKRVNASREAQELSVIEIMEQISKLEASIEVSKSKETELLAKIEEAKNQVK